MQRLQYCNINNPAKEYGLNSSVKKTKVMAVTAEKEHVHVTGMCQGCQPKQMQRFNYLGAIFTEMGDSNDEICTRSGMEKGVVQSITPLWKNISLC